VLLLISKPPDKEVLKRITKAIQKVGKPVVTMFLGAKTQGRGPSTLEEAALTAVALARREDPDEVRRRLAARDAEIQQTAKREAAKRNKEQKYVRGLFSGGTLCAEAQVLFGRMISGVYSNVPAPAAKQLKNSLVSRKNTVIDLGDDEFTIGRLHPMIDYTLRNRRIVEEARDPKTAVILLDVVLGYGANLDPASELSEVIREASGKVTVVCSITGTDQDPQNRSEVEKRLKRAGSIVMPTNAAACKLAGYIIQFLEGK
jgi:FdrA protein